MIWIINMNSSLCKIYDYQKSPAKLTLVREFSHPESRVKTGDLLTSDKPGHYKAGATQRGTFSQQTDPKDVEVDNFAREIAKHLDQARNQNKYDQVVIITAPHMNGLLLHHIDKHVKDLVTHTIQKDMVHLKEHELLEFVQENTRYPGS